MKKIFLGSSPVSSIAGYILAGLLVAQELFTKGVSSKKEIIVAIGIAILGRIVADSKDTKKEA